MVVQWWPTVRKTYRYRYAEAAAQFSLKIIPKKTKCLYQPEKLLDFPPDPDQEHLAQCTNFRYLESTASNNAQIDKEIMNEIDIASIAFDKLQHRLWKNRHVSIKVKCKVYRGVILSFLINGAKSWTILYCIGHKQNISTADHNDCDTAGQNIKCRDPGACRATLYDGSPNR